MGITDWELKMLHGICGEREKKIWKCSRARCAQKIKVYSKGKRTSICDFNSAV